MADEFELLAQPRSDFGTATSRRMRRLHDQVPAVIYGTGKDNQTITLEHNKVTKALENEAFFSQILTLTVDGKQEKVIVKDIQRHPSKPKVLHMDFLRVSMKQKLTMNVPIHTVGDDVAPGIKVGGVVSHLANEVEISCLPTDLPAFIEVDISNLDMDESVHLSQLVLPEGVELATAIEDDEHDHAVVSIHKPHIEAEPEEEAEAAEGEGEEGEGEAGAEADSGAKEGESGKEEPSKE